MVSATDIRVFKTTNNLGGAKLSTTVVSATPNNLFSNVSQVDQASGKDYYACVYFGNAHSTEAMNNFKLWLTDKSLPHDTTIEWGFDPQATAQTIANANTSPVGVFWNQLTVKPSTPNYGKLSAGVSFPIWIHYHVNANAIARLDDSELFAFAFNIPQGGTGSSGGGSGGDVGAGYHYSPFGTFDNVSDCITVPDTAALDLDNFSISVWFRTTHDFASAEGTFVRKGFGFYQSDADVKNYFIKINNDPHANALEAGFEELGGTLHPVFTDGMTWNDGNWHNAWVTYDGATVILYVDNVVIMTHSTSATPGTNSRALYVGADPDEPTSSSHRVYFGDMDETRVWNVAVTATEISAYWNTGTVPQQSAIVYENTFGGSGSSGGGSGGSGGTGGNPPPANADYKIAVAGDWGCENETDDVISLINSQGYDYIIGVGDNAYSSPDCWINRFTPLKSKMDTAFGNHEYEESGGISPYKTMFGYNLTYFTHRFQNVFVLYADSNINFDVGSAQYNFIVSALNSVKNDNTVTWKIFVDHHPWFGASSQHSYNDGNIVGTYHQLLIDNDVSFVLTGHNHNWQRTYQVSYNSGSPTSPNVLSSTSPYSRTANGLIHVVSGTGGHDSGSGLYSLGSQPSFQAYQNRTNNGVWEILASNNGQTLTCQFREIGGDTFDTFVINA